MSSPSDEKCDMKKCLNIGSTEEFVWNSLLNLLKNTNCLITSLKSSIENDNLEFSLLVGQSERRVLERLSELKDHKETVIKSLVEIEKQNLLNSYSSPDVYKSLKNSLNDDLREVSSEIEYLNSLRKRTGRQTTWYSNLTLLGSYFRSHSEWTVEGKTKVLSTILDRTVVSYNHSDQTHELNTRLKVPLDNYVTNSGRVISTPAVIKSFETPLKSRKSTQISADYSTVTKFPRSGGSFLIINVLFKSSNLWVSPYSQYQQRLFNIIRSQHDEQGKNFVEICNYLISNGYKSTRGKDLTQSIVWSIYTKKKKSIQRFGRVFDPVITDVKLDLIDYFPHE